MYTLEIESKTGSISYPLQGVNNLLIRTTDLTEARKIKSRNQCLQLKAYIMNNDVTVDNIKVISLKEVRK